jgi:hypothetical protein
MRPKLQVRLGLFLVVCTVMGSVAGIGLRWWWQPQVRSQIASFRKTPGGSNYSAYWMWERPAFEPPRLLNCLLTTTFNDLPTIRTSNSDTSPESPDLEILPNGIFYRKQLIGGYGDARLVIALSRDDVRVIPLSREDLQALNAAVGNSMLESSVWKKKVEPEIDRLIAASRDAIDRPGEQSLPWKANQNGAMVSRAR